MSYRRYAFVLAALLGCGTSVSAPPPPSPVPMVPVAEPSAETPIEPPAQEELLLAEVGGSEPSPTRPMPDHAGGNVRGRVNFGGVTPATPFADQISRALRARASSIRRCYETSLRSEPTLAGSLTFTFMATPAGRATGASASSNTTGNIALASCVRSVFSRLRWSNGPTTATRFSVNLTLTPTN